MTGAAAVTFARAVGVLGAVLLPLAPVVATTLLVGLGLIDGGRPRHRASRSWGLLWLPSMLLVLTHHGREAWRFDAFTGPLVLLGIGLLLPMLRPGQVMAMWFGGLALVGLLLVERHVAATTWHTASEARSVGLERYRAIRAPQPIVGGETPTWVERRWRGLTVTPDLALELELRHVHGMQGTAWFASDPHFLSEPLPDRPFSTRVVPPQQGEPYLTRRVTTDGPLAQRTFRVTIELRASEHVDVTDSDCLGVLLREVGGSGSAACFAQEITSSWETMSFEWTAPPTASSSMLRIELRVPASWYEVGVTLLEEATQSGWVPLAPLEPTGVRVAFAPEGSAPLAWLGPTLIPPAERTLVRVPVPSDAVSPGGELRVLLRAEPGTTIEVTSPRLVVGDTTVGRPVPMPQRGQLWFDHPNLAAHGVVAASIGVASLSGSPLGVAAAAAVGTFGASLTGSRTAFIALALTCTLLLLVTLRRSHRDVTLIAGAVVTVLVVLATSVGPLASRLDLMHGGEQNQVGRAEIWTFAVGEMLTDPWGVEDESFTEAWVAAHPNDPRPEPTHAHDLWLHYGALYGIPGLLVAVAFTVGLILHIGPRRHPAVAVGLLGLFTLQISDTTLFSFPVSLIVILLVAAVRDDSVKNTTTTADTGPARRPP